MLLTRGPLSTLHSMHTQKNTMKSLNFVLLLSLIGLLPLGSKGQSQACDGTLYFSMVENGVSQFYRFSGSSLSFELLSQFTPGINGMGFNPDDNFIYAIHSGNKLMRIDANGQAVDIGQVAGLQASTLWAADISPSGEYVITGSSPEVHRIDVSGPVPTLLGSATKFYVDASHMGTPNIGDIVFDAVSGNCYGFDSNSDMLVIIDPETGAVETVGQPQNDIPVVGAMYSDVAGELYGFVFDKIYRIDKTTGAFTYLMDGPFNEGGIDACACPYYLDLLKTASQNLACAGDTLAFKFNIRNSSRDELIGLNFTDSLSAPLEVIGQPSQLFGGTLSGSPTWFGISDMTVPVGLSSFEINVVVPDTISLPLEISNQARMFGFSSLLPSQVLSDDPSTSVDDDPTVVSFSPQPTYSIDIQQSSPICLGGDATLRAQAPEQGAFVWTAPGGLAETGDSLFFSSVLPEQEGRYELTFTNTFGCRVDTFLELDVLPQPILDLGADTAICLESGYVLRPGNQFATYTWQDGSATSQYLVTEYGEYAVTVSNSHGCTASDTVLFSPGCPARLYVPNAFSPNGDGVNDTFRAYGLEVVQFELQVFDRWGGQVFTSNNLNEGWDGNFRGEEMGAGVFAYRLQATFLNGQTVEQFGDVLLLR